VWDQTVKEHYVSCALSKAGSIPVRLGGKISNIQSNRMSESTEYLTGFFDVIVQEIYFLKHFLHKIYYRRRIGEVTEFIYSITMKTKNKTYF